MKRGDFIGDVLKRYCAFYKTITVQRENSGLVGLSFLFKSDTVIPNRPIFTVNDELYDYSNLLNVKIDESNYNTFMKDAGIQIFNIHSVSRKRAETIMENNIMAILRLEKMFEKANLIKSIKEE